MAEAGVHTEREHRSGRRSAVLIGLVTALLALAWSGAAASAADSLVVANITTTAYPSVVLSVDVPAGAPALAPGDLTVSEDGRAERASVERLAGDGLEVVLALDTSFAVGEPAFAPLRDAAAQFVDRMPDGVRVGVVRFGGGAEVLARATADRPAAKAAIAGLRRSGDVPLYDGLVAAAQAFSGAARDRLVVLVSAAGDDASANTLDAALAGLTGAHVEVVSLESALTSPLALARVAIEGRGTVHKVAPAAVGTGLDEVADAILGRYTITYVSTGRPAGDPPSIVVRVASPFGTVDSRVDVPAAAVAALPAPPATTVAPPTTVVTATTAAAAPATTAVPAPAGAPAPTTAAASTPLLTTPATTIASGDDAAVDAGGRTAVAPVVVGLLLVGALAAVVAANARQRRRPSPEVHVADDEADGSDAGDGRFGDLLAARVGRDLRESLDEVTSRRVTPVGPALVDDSGLDDADEPGRYDYERYSALTGPLHDVDDEVDADGEVRPHRVAFRPSLPRRQRMLVLPLLAVNMALATAFYVWLVQPAHLPETGGRGWVLAVLAYVMLAGIALIEGMRLISSFALSWWAWRASDPIPVRPESGLRVAFTTTIVPGKEPIDVVRRTLEAARRIEYDGTFDVWLLDEGDDPEVRAMCRQLGVRHFTRHGVAKWNRPSGRFKARTKHGNHNAWLAAHGRRYDVEISVDPDHAPLPNVADRLLGYFRDPDVAFVCGPQVYGNYDRFLTRAAESQAYLFQSVIQRAANRDDCGMFVGTNHAYRIEAWRQIGGFQDSITEDMATSFAVHGAVNAETGNPWRSVYTPDVIAVGEGPATWTDFFSQQLRWSRGTDEVLVRGGWQRFRSLPTWGRKLHYALLCSYYPFVATGWMLGLLLSAVYVLTGATGLHLTDLRSWFTLYADLAIVQASLYFWLRRLNVSPHEPEGSAGVSGMFVSMLATPVYVAALVGAVLKRPLSFVVTPKGASATADGWHTFRRHLRWAALSVVVMVGAFAGGRALWAALLAPAICLFVAVTPVVLWRLGGRDGDEVDERPALRVADDEEDLMLAGHSA